MDKKFRPLLLRADASTTIGTGHVMRLLALVAAWRTLTAGNSPVNLIGDITIAGLHQRLNQSAIQFRPISHSHPDPQDLKEFAHIAIDLQPAWIVLDGYNFDSDYQFSVRALGFPLLIIDDLAHHPHYHADLLLNSNPDAAQLAYKVENKTRLLFGSRFCLLRPELHIARNMDKAPITILGRKLLITMGGADPQRLSFLALQTCIQLGPEWEIKIVLGSANPFRDELQRRAFGLTNVEILIDVANMGLLMLWADLALAAAGTTTWELAYLGVPTLLIAAADNQIRVAAIAHTTGCAINLGWWAQLTIPRLVSELNFLAENFQQRLIMRTAGQILVDGNGALRVVQAMLEY